MLAKGDTLLAKADTLLIYSEFFVLSMFDSGRGLTLSSPPPPHTPLRMRYPAQRDRKSPFLVRWPSDLLGNRRRALPTSGDAAMNAATVSRSAPDWSRNEFESP
jgi:hypothetical protein